MGRQPPHTRPVQVRDPQIVRVSERDTVAAHRGVGEEPRVVDVDGKKRDGGQQKHEKGQRAKSHEGSFWSFSKVEQTGGL